MCDSERREAMIWSFAVGALKLLLGVIGLSSWAAKLKTRTHDEETGAIAEEGREANQAVAAAKARSDEDQAVNSAGVDDLRQRVLADKRDDTAGQ